MKASIIFIIVLALYGCKDRYQDGYDAGYATGVSSAEARLKSEYEEKLRNYEDKTNRLSVTSTEVCGGGGVNVNNKHYPGGKTGCVRAYSDGRVVRY